METLKRLAGFARVLAVVLLAVSAAGCANTAQDAAGLGPGRGPATPGSQRDFVQNVGDIVYFSTDSTDLTPEAQQTLTGQARWLRQYPQYTITIEGHADERGTREYNIALGARRATSVRNYLVQNGVGGQPDQADVHGVRVVGQIRAEERGDAALMQPRGRPAVAGDAALEGR